KDHHTAPGSSHAANRPTVQMPAVSEAANRPTVQVPAVGDPTARHDQRIADTANQAQLASTARPVAQIQRDIHDDLPNLAALSNLPDAVIGTHQASRVPAALRALSDADYQAFRALHDSLHSPIARGFLLKALAAQNSMADLHWLASQMAFKGDDW